MRARTLLVGLTTCLYHVMLAHAVSLREDFPYESNDVAARDLSENAYIGLEGEAVTPFPRNQFGDAKDANGEKRAAEIAGFWKRDGDAFWKRSGGEPNAFWKRFGGDQGFWKRANAAPSGFWKRSGDVGFWKRAPGGDAQQFWKRVPSRDLYQGFWKRGLGPDSGQSNFWKRSERLSVDTTARETRGADNLEGFWKRAPIPWNMMMLPEYRQQLLKAKQPQNNPLPPKNRRKGPKLNPEFNPTGW